MYNNNTNKIWKHMCLSPISLPEKGGNFYIENKKLGTAKKIIADPYEIHTSPRMLIPCGHCSQCIAIAQMEMVERIQMEAMSNTIYMGTLTYNNECLPRVVTSQGYEYRYANHKHASDMIRRLRDNNTFGIPFKYLIVSERGSKRARPHFHILLLFRNEDIGPKYLDKWNFEQEYKWTLFNEWKEKIGGTTNNAIYRPLCDYRESYKGRRKRTTYDFHYVQPKYGTGITDAAFYVLKYMLKNSTHEEKIRQALKINYDYKQIDDPDLKPWELSNLDAEEEGQKIWEMIRSKREYSLGFGLGMNYKLSGKDRSIKEEYCDSKIIDYLKDGIERSKREKHEYAYYYCPENLNTFPLANYYKKFGFIYKREDEDYFYNIDPERYRNRYLMPERPGKYELIKQINKFNEIIKLQQMEEIADDFDELLNF